MNKENIIDSSFIKDIHAIIFEDTLKVSHSLFQSLLEHIDSMSDI